jgi:hypothetical protein
MSSRKMPSYRPAAAIDDTWWKVPALIALANCDRVARALDVQGDLLLLSASAFRS